MWEPIGVRVSGLHFICFKVIQKSQYILALRGKYASAYGAELRSVFLPSFAVPSPRFARPKVSVTLLHFGGVHAAKKGWLGGHFFRTRVRRVRGAYT